MQAVIEKVGTSPHSSFVVEHNTVHHFISPWHYHPEVEIILIEQGTGTVFVGDYISKFSSGTVAIIGTNVPHVWMNDQDYYAESSEKVAESIVIKFDENFPGDTFLHLPEFQKIRKLLINASRGLIFTGWTAKSLTRSIRDITQQLEFKRLMTLFEILDLMSRTKEFFFMASEGYINNHNRNNKDDCKRIDNVYKYVMNNFSQRIELSKVAEVANMSPTAFCRYFKSRTLKTFSAFLNEIRIGNACRLLQEKQLSISEIAYQSGFNFLANFHKQFKKQIGMTPLEYQQKYWDSSSELHRNDDVPTAVL